VADEDGPDARGALRHRLRRVVPARLRGLVRRETVGHDLNAGMVLGVESVPDGLASGLLAGVNPLAGLYAYLFGLAGAALFTSSAFLAVQATGAMALVVSDVDLASRADPERALFTLSVLTGLVMVAAGLLGAGSLLRFVPTAVMTGFVTAVGINIVLGQLGNFTGYAASGANRVTRTLDLLLHPGRIELPTLLVGVVTLVGIVVLQRTRLQSFGLVVAVALGSLLAAWPRLDPPVALVSDLADVPRSLPTPVLPAMGDVVFLTVPAMSLAFVGLVQGAAVAAAVPRPGNRPVDARGDFVGQGAGNIVSGLFQGMPVGGSMSASSLVVTAGARTRLSLLAAAGVMAVVVLLLADVVGLVAMPALAALLITVGVAAIKPSRVRSVIRTGPLQTTVMTVTLVLTLVIPLQYAVLMGVGFAIVMYVGEQSNKVSVRRLVITEDGRTREEAAPEAVPGHAVVVLQPYGSLFFASAPVFRDQLPLVTRDSAGSVVVVRLRGVDQLGLSLIEVLDRYARQLAEHGSSLKLVVGNTRVRTQLEHEGLLDLLGADNVYLGTEWLGETVRRAYDDAVREVATRQQD
jgi:SulP family sulfate permease